MGDPIPGATNGTLLLQNVQPSQAGDYSVVVLNLDTPSALLGFQVGGIVGHKFLSGYRTVIDLDRSLLRLKRAS